MRIIGHTSAIAVVHSRPRNRTLDASPLRSPAKCQVTNPTDVEEATAPVASAAYRCSGRLCYPHCNCSGSGATYVERRPRNNCLLRIRAMAPSEASVSPEQIAECVADLGVGLDLVVLAEDRDDVGVVHLGQRGVGGFAETTGLLAEDHDEELAGLDGLDLSDRLQGGCANARVAGLAVDAGERVECVREVEAGDRDEGGLADLGVGIGERLADDDERALEIEVAQGA